MAFRLLLLFFCLSCLGGCVQTEQTQEIPLQKPAIDVSIAALKENGHLIIHLSTADPHIDVVIRNISSQPLNFINENCSWGYDNLRLELIGLDDKILPKPIIVERSPSGHWYSNVFGFKTLEPGAMMVREVHFIKDVSMLPGIPYENFPAMGAGGDLKIRMRAVFTVPAPTGKNPFMVWTGSVASETHDYWVQQYSN